MILGLTTLSVLLVRPPRSWIDRWIVSKMIHRDLKVQELHFHTDDSVVETRNLAWHARYKGRSVELHSPLGWFAMDPEALIDARLKFPMAVLEDAHLYLEDGALPTVSPPSIWQQHLAGKIAQLDWQEIEKHFNSLLAADRLSEIWSERIERWIQRSQSVLEQARVLESDTQSLDNPLRSEELIQEKIARLGQLTEEQQQLIGQFDGAGKLLLAETNRLSEMRDEELEWLASLITDVPHEADGAEPSIQHGLAERTLIQLCGQLWEQYYSFAEVVDLLTHTAGGQEQPSYQLDVRGDSRSLPLLDLSELKANGLFECSGRQTRFTACGHYTVRQDVDYRRQRSCQWQFQFSPRNLTIHVDVSRPEDNHLGLNHVHLQVSHARQDKDDAAVSLIDDDDTVSTPAPFLEAFVCSSDVGLEGTLSVIPSAITAEGSEPFGIINDAILSRQLPADTAIEYEIVGSWKQPRLTLHSASGTDILPAVEQEIREQLDGLKQQSATRLHEELDARLSKLRGLVATATEQGRAITTEHHDQLMATQSRLESSLNDLKNTEFARRATATKTR